MRRRPGNLPSTHHDIVEEGQNGNSPSSRRRRDGGTKKKRRRSGSHCCTKFVGFVLLVATILGLLSLAVWKWDRAEPVREKVKTWKNKVTGNTAEYATNTAVRMLLNRAPKVCNNATEYVVFVSASNGNHDSLRVGRGHSTKSAEEALKRAQTQLPRKTNKYPHVKIDVVFETLELVPFNYAEELPELEFQDPSWFGIAVGSWSTTNDWVFVPEEVVANSLVDASNMLRMERLALYASRSKRTSMELPPYFDDSTHLDELTVFTTKSLLIDYRHDQVVPVYHGHRMFESLLTTSLLHDAVASAASHLALSVKDATTGRMVYKYKPRSGREPYGYNLARHAGTVFSMARVYGTPQLSNHKELDREYLLESTTLALQFLLDSLLDCPVPLQPDKKAKCLPDYEQTTHRLSKLGPNALTLLAIVEYMDVTKSTQHLAVAASLAEWMQGSQKEDGSFVQKIYMGYENTDPVVTLEGLDENYYVRYYQGEVTFALCRFWRMADKNRWPVKNDGWLETAKRAAQFIVEQDSQEENDAHFVFDHWLLYGMAELHKIRQSNIPQQWMLHVQRTLEVALKFQNGEIKDNPDQLDELGVYYDNLSSTATATRSEGLCAVYDLMREEHRPKLLQSVELAVRYQLQTQYRPELSMYMRDPQRIQGAFRESIEAFDTRNDFTQHNTCSLLCLADVLSRQQQQQQQQKVANQ